MTKDELLTEGEDYADITGYKGDDADIAACAYMRGAMWMQEKLIEKALRHYCQLHGMKNCDAFDECKLIQDFRKAMLNENKE